MLHATWVMPQFIQPNAVSWRSVQSRCCSRSSSPLPRAHPSPAPDWRREPTARSFREHRATRGDGLIVRPFQASCEKTGSLPTRQAEKKLSLGPLHFGGVASFAKLRWSTTTCASTSPSFDPSPSHPCSAAAERSPASFSSSRDPSLRSSHRDVSGITRVSSLETLDTLPGMSIARCIGFSVTR